jgi:hypothetical protein
MVKPVSPPKSDTAKLAAAVVHLAEVHAAGLKSVSESLMSISSALHRLGNADAATPMGGLEGLGATLKEALEAAGSSIAESIQSNRSGEL